MRPNGRTKVLGQAIPIQTSERLMFALLHTYKTKLPHERFAKPVLHGAIVDERRVTWIENETIHVSLSIPCYPKTNDHCEFWIPSNDADLALPDLVQLHHYDPQILATGYASNQVLVYTYFPNEPWRVYEGLSFGTKQLIFTGNKFHITEAKHYDERNSAEYFVTIKERKLLFNEISDSWNLRLLWPEAYADVERLKKTYAI